ncbi:hypothetical protein [Fodinicola feengrottensis]|uniref:hypothetical protein n=1 Tax=Fodinicola feengrottensis TaxID=435914 RepID=UPI002442BE5B|nr:hypothetical protein [Fodinicola feengrottensis]
MGVRMRAEPVLSLTEAVGSLPDYLAVGGGAGLALVRELSPDQVIARVRESGLRGRGGSGFPSAPKWETLRSTGRAGYLTCGLADGEPGTFKDRFILRRNPYQVVEGMMIAAAVLEVAGVFVVIDRSYRTEIIALRRALSEMTADGLLSAASWCDGCWTRIGIPPSEKGAAQGVLTMSRPWRTCRASCAGAANGSGRPAPRTLPEQRFSLSVGTYGCLECTSCRLGCR